MFRATLKQLFEKCLRVTLVKHMFVLLFSFLIEVNEDITSAHSVSTLYNQRRHIFLQDICKKEGIDVIPQT